jgi:hypothetical protein
MIGVRTSRWAVVWVALTAAPGLAWSPETRVAIADDAVRLMPESLRLALERQREALLRGVLEPMAGEDGLDHRPPWSWLSLGCCYRSPSWPCSWRSHGASV